ncbi:MAG: PH domain-containing protein [Minisyncoccia bacterium]
MEEFQLEPEEEIIVAVRKHWIVFAFELVPFVFMAIFPFLLAFAFLHVQTMAVIPHPNLTFENEWVRLGLGLWWLMAWTGAFNSFTKYYLDLWVITSMRIVNIHQKSFFRREVSSFLLEHVQDVTTEVNGIFPTLFGFGLLRVETAGEDSKHFLMNGIRNPENLRDLIMREIAELHTDDRKE